MINLDEILKEDIIRSVSKNQLVFLYETLTSLLPKPDCFLEIGAYDASFSVRMRYGYPSSVIYAFEAGTPNYIFNKDKTDFESLNINYLNLAVSDKNESIDYYISKKHLDPNLPFTVFGANGIIKRIDEPEYSDVLKIESIILDSFLEDKNLIDSTKCMWIDVEGSCREVLSGSEKSLENTMAIFIEVEEISRWNNQWLRKDIENYLKSKNFFPIARDFEDNTQYDIIFLKENILKNLIIEDQIRKYFDSISLTLQ